MSESDSTPAQADTRLQPTAQRDDCNDAIELKDSVGEPWWETCGLPKGHDGDHEAPDGETWPNLALRD